MAGYLQPANAVALTAEDVVYQPADAVSSAIDDTFQDKFVYYQRDGFFVPARLLIETDIKACVDLRKPVCSTRYYSRAEVLKASSLYFAYPILTVNDVVNSTLRPAVENRLMEVVTTWSMSPQGLVLQMEVEKRLEGSTDVERFTRWARFSPSREYAGLRMNFGKQVSPNAWMESLTRLRRDRLRGFADAAIRINNHFYSEKAGKKRIRHGSGFFYRGRNRVMTAWHNLAPNPDCRTKLRCSLRFMHTDSRGVKRRFRQTVDIVAHNQSADFAVIQLRTPQQHSGECPADCPRPDWPGNQHCGLPGTQLPSALRPRLPERADCRNGAVGGLRLCG